MLKKLILIGAVALSTSVFSNNFQDQLLREEQEQTRLLHKQVRQQEQAMRDEQIERYNQYQLRWFENHGYRNGSSTNSRY